MVRMLDIWIVVPSTGGYDLIFIKGHQTTGRLEGKNYKDLNTVLKVIEKEVKQYFLENEREKERCKREVTHVTK